MNPGYLSLILTSVTIILLVSGWKDYVLRNISHKVILVFFISWFGSSLFTITIAEQKVNGVIAVLVLLSAIILQNESGLLVRVHLLSLGLLLGSIYFMLQEIMHLNLIPMISVLHVDTAVLIALLVAAALRNLLQQIAVITIGFLVGESFYIYVNHNFSPIVFGGSLFQDRWWLSIISVRIVTLCLESVLHVGKGFYRFWQGLRKGLKK